MQRPTGITVLAIVDFLSGALSLAISCFALAVSNRQRPGAEEEDFEETSSVLTLDLAFRRSSVFWIGLIGTGISLFKLSAAVGLWTLKPWGRQLALVSGTINFLTHALVVIRGAITPSGLMGLLVNGAVLLYLTRPDVRRALADGSTTAP